MESEICNQEDFIHLQIMKPDGPGGQGIYTSTGILSPQNRFIGTY